MSYVQPQPIPGLAIKPPATSPQAGQVIVGYEKFRYPADCCDCNGLNESALIWLLVLFILGLMFIFPFLCLPIPLCMEDCRKEYQRPIYGYPAAGAQAYAQAAQYAVAAPAPVPVSAPQYTATVQAGQPYPYQPTAPPKI